MKKARIAILASGSGTNTENIIRYFKTNEKIEVSLVLSNKVGSGVLEKADKHGVPAIAFSSHELNDRQQMLGCLQRHHIDFIVLAGFLKLVPAYLVKAYPQKIINIHPALLPKYGGKGMYGEKVHQAVKANKEAVTGITIHYVNESYDEGAIICQKKCPIDPENESVVDIKEKVHELEYTHYPRIIEQVVHKEVFGNSTANH